MLPKDTPGLIAYRIETKLGDKWYYWGTSPTPVPHVRYNMGEIRSTPIWAAEHEGKLKHIEARLAERLGLTGDVQAQLIQLDKDGKLVEDELVAEWHQEFAWYLER